ncbi:glutathione s-transferase [Diplodia corticola]|uniref:Glutathione s-transferase n=1 Tax=Diplodia corticola TaxID=236234 RepID=A0A1J9RZ72_9PEZI|nr:glutathione s-transferase [Diplodia corticola]OJD32749.1 glutathione s-transferase [Diplodia corticola]
MAPLILFDLPTKGHRVCWSLNPWKTRMALNYKNIEYETEWLEYPDVAPTLKAKGLPPNEGDPNTVIPYTIPTVQFPDGTYVMDSLEIARELEKRYANVGPSLRLDAPVVAQVIDAIPKVMKPLAGALLPRCPRVLLSEKSAAYFYETRKERFGMSLDQYEAEKGGEPAWADAKQPIENLAALLKQTTDGPYFLGNEVSYADFIVASLLRWVKLLGLELYDRFVAHDKALDDLYKACAKWLERDDH